MSFHPTPCTPLLREGGQDRDKGGDKGDRGKRIERATGKRVEEKEERNREFARFMEYDLSTLFLIISCAIFHKLKIPNYHQGQPHHTQSRFTVV